MTLIQSARNLVAAALAGLDATVYATWPTDLTPPLVWIAPPLDGAFIGAGDTFSTYLMSLDVVIAVEHGEQLTSYSELETLLEQALAACSQWPLVGVNAPAPVTLTANGTEYFGTIIHIQVPFSLR